jgi:hypothetical protein
MQNPETTNALAKKMGIIDKSQQHPKRKKINSCKIFLLAS